MVDSREDLLATGNYDAHRRNSQNNDGSMKLNPSGRA